MLTRKDFGMHVTGRVDSKSELKHRSGKTQKGADYSFWQQSITLAMGGSQVEVVYRADSDPGHDLCSLDLDDIVRLKVQNPREFGGKMSFDVAE
jgi:hypothetical protein